MQSRRRSSGINILPAHHSSGVQQKVTRYCNNEIRSEKKNSILPTDNVVGNEKDIDKKIISKNNNNKEDISLDPINNKILENNHNTIYINNNNSLKPDKGDSFQRNSELLNKNLRSQPGIERHKLHLRRIKSFDNTIRKTNEFLLKVQASKVQ